jgi:hypothetical protein
VPLQAYYVVPIQANYAELLQADYKVLIQACYVFIRIKMLPVNATKLAWLFHG